MKHYIYGLIDPRDYKVRYVGRTTKRMDTRLREHSFYVATDPRPVYVWLRSLGQSPWLVCLEVSSDREGAITAETKWLKRHRLTVLNRRLRENHPATWDNLTNRLL